MCHRQFFSVIATVSFSMYTRYLSSYLVTSCSSSDRYCCCCNPHCRSLFPNMESVDILVASCCYPCLGCTLCVLGSVKRHHMASPPIAADGATVGLTVGDKDRGGGGGGGRMVGGGDGTTITDSIAMAGSSDTSRSCGGGGVSGQVLL